MFAALHGKGDLAALAFEFSPLVEQSAPDIVTFDVSGLDRLCGLAQDIAAAIARRAREAGIQANLAVAANPDAAICAARGFPGVSVIPQNDETKFLAPLPLALLTPSPELQETLRSWGIRWFHEMAALPTLGIAERLGREGLRLQQLARGAVMRKLLPLEDPPGFHDEVELEYPIELLEPLAFLLARLLNGLTMRLATRGLATNELRLSLRLETRAMHERTLRLPVPSLDSRAFLKLLQLDLAAHPPPAPIVHVALAMNPVKPCAVQSGLFIPAAPEPVRLEVTTARIRAIVGQGAVGSPELLDTHRPDAFQMKEFGRAKPPASVSPRVRLILRRFRPPLAARVEIVRGRPEFVSATGVRGKVIESAGPWRTAGDWWTSSPWSRDEWDLALSDGALYRVYCTLEVPSPQPVPHDPWFIEGSYD